MTHELFDSKGLLGSAPAAFVAGEYELDSSHGTLPVINPANGQLVAEVPSSSSSTVDRAVTAAVAAQREWGRRSHVARAAVLEAVRDAIAVHADELARIVSVEQGKPLSDARGETEGACAFFDFAISQKYRAVGSMMASEPGRSLGVREEPIGVVAAILPWNFPVAIFARKVAPALMAGNAVVLKPSELTPLSALALARLCRLAGVPDGLLSVVCGEGKDTGRALVTHPGVGMVTMTGSTRGGREILAQVADQIIPVSLELGGKAPFIVFEDADLDAAVEAAADARLWNTGQVCTCNEVTYVHADLHDEFVRRVVDRFASVTPLDPFAAGSRLGPLVAERERTRVQGMVDAAVAAGARVRTGGGRPDGEQYQSGAWFAPTVLTNVRPEMDIARREVFGPVLPIIPFDAEAEVVSAANSTAYGLTAYVYTRDLSRAMRMIDALEFGEVYVNQAGPEQVQGFHTGWKSSGLGGDDGPHGYEKYLRRKTVYVRHAV
ncbi:MULTISPECIES: 3,6-anhydro-alpha-L-galactose dehydrogenase [Streptomyces]|uniref:3,6-anhydro-alpha-L-galactose dehydrogenase n=1 Tax=Streptomyces coelicolor (strain ATCC BAA-471 / A3(2) / M145) TaxID=100226 RepID=AHGD_STRCO|nr:MULTISPECIES: aldehyde dehydrogenase family protein [Streptomyces]Q9RKF1.1 RecName: Full=3,6-anhydro-alpha-L-galactose dehydrogenase; Short=AHG dehydrogenase [Streptomyces coelicolor A3(2)]MYU43010.1 aldehyde dehydrogenase family protein [Streptomyces sp. SID7813]MDX2930519.1 aldehyde dehydrogenase family protein [Streptomyces sp. NRRL_B-16638]MDX3406063.1 aldehyde dehydrogenase family protein [Streptomyces sp. ME02-6977A]NSL85094.1 aldehyde dehydrogenase family protein [Streptomyces coelic